MPFCGDCRNWIPSKSDDNERDFLDVAYHDFDCGVRMMEDWEGQLANYIFEGDIMFEVLDDGSKVSVSTYSDYPAPYNGPPIVVEPDKSREITQEMPPVAPAKPALTADGIVIREYSWEQWKTAFPSYATRVETTELGWKRPKAASQTSSSSHYVWKPPWEEIDRKKWPNTWLFAVKFHFLPSTFKETKYTPDNYSSTYYGGEN